VTLREHRSSGDRLLDVVDRRKCPFDPIRIIRLTEPGVSPRAGMCREQVLRAQPSGR
jgi:hypothetical protein